jgi:acyl-CoA thioesterase-1
METWLRENGADVRLINAAVPGDTTSGGLSRIEWSLTPDVDGMIVALGANDYLRGLPPKLTQNNLTGIREVLETAEVEVLLVGVNVGSNFGPEYKSSFDEIYPSLANEFETLYVKNWFAGLLATAGMQEGFSEFMQDDGLHPNAEGVKVIVAAMGPTVLELITQISLE